MKHLVLALTFFIGLSACKKETPIPNPPPPPPASSAIPPPPNITENNRVRIDSVSVKKSNKVAEINIVYPVLKGLTDTKIQQAINDSLKVTAGTDITEPNGTEMPNGFDASYQVSLLNDKILSLTQTLYQFTGGAHGGTVIRGRNFDLSTGTELKLHDVLASEKSLAKIAELCRADLEKQHTFEERWMMEGTDPKEPNNYSGFWFSKEGLHINFGQYQIASYAEGMFEVKIPYDQLNDVLSTEILAKVK